MALLDVAGVSFAAYLPDFGAPQGMVISGLTSSAEGEGPAASEAGLYRSGLSDASAECDRSQFQAALDDWAGTGRPRSALAGTPAPPGSSEIPAGHGGW